MAVVDANSMFQMVDVGGNGRISDGGIFDNTEFAHLLQMNQLNIPKPTPLPGLNKPVPFVFVADDAFSLSEHVMKPYPQIQLDHEK